MPWYFNVSLAYEALKKDFKSLRNLQCWIKINLNGRFYYRCTAELKNQIAPKFTSRHSKMINLNHLSFKLCFSSTAIKSHF